MEQNWQATIGLSKDEMGMYHVIANVDAPSKELALEGAKFIKKVFTQNRETFMRFQPEAESFTDFDTKITSHRGFVRFTVRDEPGLVHIPEPTVQISLGELSHGC
jgi:hypothetical protein